MTTAGLYTLVIVDMQPSFKASRAVVSAVEDEVRRAVSAKASVVVLQYRNRGRTHRQIMDLLEETGVRYSVAWKDRDDGSDHVERICLDKGYERSVFRLCGVNTHACVKLTAVGLTRRYARVRIEIATAACNGPSSNNWKRFPRHRNIHLDFDLEKAA